MEKTIKYLENGEYHYATVKDVGDLAKLKTDSKDDLVTAINELFITGGEGPKKPDGYDELVDNVADAIQKQQQMTDTITNMQQSAQLSDAEMEHMKQVQEELHQEYLKAIKELNEAVDKAKADAADLDKKTSDLQDKLDETFASVDKEVSDVHKQLDSESAGLRKDLDDTKTSLESTRKDLLNNTQEFGVVNSEVKELKDKMDRRIWSTDLDPVREQVNKNTTEVSQTKDELKNKADQSSLDLVTNSVENLSTQVKENADGLKVSVKKDELGGDVARLLNDKTNLLLGTRNFSGSNWLNKEYWHEEPGYWNGLKVYSSEQQYYGIQYQYYVKAGNTYTFSLWAKQDVENLQAAFYLLAENKEGIVDPLKQENVIVKTEWTRVHITFDALQDAFIYPRLEQTVVKNKLYVAGYKLELGKNATPWEPNEADIAENIEHTESQFNVYSDQIAGIVKKQEKMGDTERQLDTRITETAEGLKQTSKNLEDANGKITEFKGQLESTAKGLMTEYEKYTNDAIGQISDSSLNLIHNSAFSNQDDQFESWQNISAKATVREDSNNLHWVELTQSGQGTDNPIGVTSNYFIIKQGKVTVAVDVKLGDKANLDNQNILLLELYDESKKRVDFTDVSVSQLGLSMSVLNDHNVHRGLYRLGIDRKDVKYMTVKAILHRNGDLWLTNFSARLSSIDDGGYTPNPDDLSQQILKMNTKIEEDAEHIALKANSVDVTRVVQESVGKVDSRLTNEIGNVNNQIDSKTKAVSDKVDNIRIGGRNLIKGTDKDFVVSLSDLHDPGSSAEYIYWPVAQLIAGKTYTFSADMRGVNTTKASLRIFDLSPNSFAAMPGNSELDLDIDGSRKSWTFTVANDGHKYSLLLYAGQSSMSQANNKVIYHHAKLEFGNMNTDWTPAPEDVDSQINTANGKISTLQSATQWHTVSGPLDLNDLKTQQRIFYQDTQEKNSAVSGWQYITVDTSNNTRITQTVWKDNVTTQYSRQCTNDVWTQWTRNANQADIDKASNGLRQEIKSAKDAAINVASDKIEIKANEIKTITDQNLNTRINEVKTASEKYTSDGIEQVVKKVSEVKNNVDGLGNRLNDTQSAVNGVSQKIDNLQVGGRNLVRNTDTDIVIDDTGNTGTQGWRFATINLTQQPKVGDQITVSAEATLTGQGDLSTYDVILYNQAVGSARSNSKRLSSGKRASATLQVNNLDGNGDTVLLIYAGNISDTEGKKNTVHHLKVEFGNVATDWTPAPEDINQKIDTQTLDSANIDEMKTQGHYFVKNLTGNPIGGWVYVEVTGNNADRIRQDVYQDSGSKHMYRRFFGDSWSDWEQGAYLSDVNSLKTEVTASVKNLGDRVTTEVNSITSRVNSNNGGGINLQVGTDDCSFPIGNNGNEVNIESYSGTTKMFHAKKGGFYSSYNAKSFVPTPGETYTLSADVKGNGTISGDLFRYEGGDNGNLGTIKLTNDWQRISNTVHINKVSGQWVFYIRDSNDFYVKHIKIERGSVATPWSPAPEDTVEAIKQLNTKWDVANGQIQGKVTATDVNNILNGKGYATQSWAESNFRMKSDSIDLEVRKITDPISDKINNLQVGGRNLLHGTSDQWRKFTNSGWGCFTTAQSSEVSTAEYHTGNVFTYSATISNNGKHDVALQLRPLNSQKKPISYYGSAPVKPGQQNMRVSCTAPVDTNTWYMSVWVYFPNNDGSNDIVWVKEEQFEEGNVRTPWTPNPDDVNQQITNTNNKIDTQTLDSANIDQMKTQGHYFVKNLTGNPIGGWVYVDVTGNNNDRIRQDVYADQSYVHKFRSWNGSRWTDWEEEVKNTDIISKINISPENIRLSSNKIEIDGDTEIKGTLKVPTVRLQGKSGMIGLDGNSGIIISSADTLFQTRVTRYGMDFLTSTNGKKEIVGGITTGANANDNNINGISIVLDTGQKLGDPYGGDFFSIGSTTSIKNNDDRTWSRAMDYDASGQLHQGGFMWYEHSTLASEGKQIRIDGANDPLYISATKFGVSAQPNYYQPTIRAGWNENTMSNAGIGFLWNQVKPFGNWDISDMDSLWFNGQEFKFTWVSHPSMMGNMRVPSFVKVDPNGGISSGISFAPGSVWSIGSASSGNITRNLLV